MSALDELLDAFEEEDSQSGPSWYYNGSVDPKTAAVELAALREQNRKLREAAQAVVDDAKTGVPISNPVVLVYRDIMERLAALLKEQP